MFRQSLDLGICVLSISSDNNLLTGHHALQAIKNPDVQYPLYYTKPFHAYEDGNLCLEAALEVSMAAKSVHALVMDPAGKELDPEYVMSIVTDTLGCHVGGPGQGLNMRFSINTEYHSLKITH